MPKYRMQITVITDQGVRLTNVYVSECGSMGRPRPKLPATLTIRWTKRALLMSST